MEQDILFTALKKHILCVLCALLVSFASSGQAILKVPQNVSLQGASYSSGAQSIVYFSDTGIMFDNFSSKMPEWLSAPGIQDVTASLVWGNDELLLFDGSSYARFQPSTGVFLSEWQQWPGLPAQWRNKLTAAVPWSGNLILFVNGTSYTFYDSVQQEYVDSGDVTTWNLFPSNWTGIDAIINLNDDFIYFISNNEVVSYSLIAQQFDRVTGLSNRPIASNNSQNNTKKEPKPEGLSAPEVVQIAGCPVGKPEGSNYVSQTSDIIGDTNSRSISDNFKNGSVIQEVNVYTTKSWGKTVIAGLECKLLSNTGDKLKSKVFGRKTSTFKVFDVDDSCITGLRGVAGVASANAIDNIQILTSDGGSEVYGNRAARGGTAIDIMLPENANFNGFTGTMKQNISAIGMMYYGTKKQSKPVPVKTKQYVANSAESLTSDQATQLAMGTPPNMIEGFGTEDTTSNESVDDTEDSFEVVDEYIDDYDDFTSELGNMAEFMVQPLSGIDWLGAGFDILYYDALKPNDLRARKRARTVQITNSPARAGNNSQYLKPFGSTFGSANSGAVVDSSSWVSSYQQFTNSFSLGMSPKVSVPKVASGSASAGYKSMRSNSLGTSSIYLFTKTKRAIHEVELDYYWIDNAIGQKYKQKLDVSFVKDVKALKVPRGAVEDLKIEEKNQKLPSDLGILKGQYYQLIQKYGTHLAKRVTYGGQYISRTQIKRSQYEKSRMTEVDFKAEAEVQIKAVKVGNSVNFAMQDGESSSKSAMALRRDVFVQGGNGETNLSKWEDKVDKSMAPIDIYFDPISELLIPQLFADDPDIVKKQEVMEIMIEKYVMDTYVEPNKSKDDFFRALPDLPMPSVIMVKNGGGYVMWFTVKYEHKGKWVTKESGNFTLGFTEDIEIPVGAKNLTITAEQTTGEIFKKFYAKPESASFKTWGTIFSTGWEKTQ